MVIDVVERAGCDDPLERQVACPQEVDELGDERLRVGIAFDDADQPLAGDEEIPIVETCHGVGAGRGAHHPAGASRHRRRDRVTDQRGLARRVEDMVEARRRDAPPFAGEVASGGVDQVRRSRLARQPQARRHIRVDPDHVRLGADRMRREGRLPEEAAVPRYRGVAQRRRSIRLPAEEVAREEEGASARRTAATCCAVTAIVEGQHDRVAWRNRCDLVPDFLDDAHALVAEDDRKGGRQRVVAADHVGVAYADCHDPHEDFARLRLLDPETLDGHFHPRVASYGRPDFPHV